jgi:predicted MFS family arabinose efflux permease
MIAPATPGRGATRAWAGVAAITASLFVFLTTELMPVGILTPMSRDLGVAVGRAGLIVTLYGFAAGLGVTFIVAWTRRVDRKLLLVLLLGVLTAGNVCVAAAPTFELVLLTRLAMGCANGVFWAIGVSMAVRLVPDALASRAAAVVMSGISVATVVGIPMGTFIEDVTSWRVTFLVEAGLGAFVLVAVASLVPSMPSTNTVTVSDVFRLPIAIRPLRAVLGIVVLFVLGHFASYTYIRPLLEDRGDASPAFVTVVLMVFGAAGAVGNFVAGFTIGDRIQATFVTGVCGILLSFPLLLASADNKAAIVFTLMLWGLAFGVVQLCQVNMTLAAAPDKFEAAMSLNTMAYNTSTAGGALIGGLVIDLANPSTLVWTSAALIIGALALSVSKVSAPAVRGQADSP